MELIIGICLKYFISAHVTFFCTNLLELLIHITHLEVLPNQQKIHPLHYRYKKEGNLQLMLLNNKIGKNKSKDNI